MGRLGDGEPSQGDLGRACHHRHESRHTRYPSLLVRGPRNRTISRKLKQQVNLLDRLGVYYSGQSLPSKGKVLRLTIFRIFLNQRWYMLRYSMSRRLTTMSHLEKAGRGLDRDDGRPFRERSAQHRESMSHFYISRS